MSDTVFVGREEELAKLTATLDRALAGKGQVIFIAGDAGSGKSALLTEFARRALAAHPNLIIAQGTCNAQTGIGEAYLPFREVLGVLTGGLETNIAEHATAAENSNRIRKLLARTGLLLIDVAPDLVKLVPVAGVLISPLGKSVIKQTGVEDRLKAVAEQRNELLEMGDQTVSQELIFEQCYNFLMKIAEFQPLVLALDDLQWADTSSVSLLFYLARRLTDQRIMLIGNFRSDEIAAGRDGGNHPTRQLYTEMTRIHGDILIDLARFDPEETCRFVEKYLDSEPNAFSRTFRDALAHHTRGNPLFLVELMHDLQERGLLIKDNQGRWIEPAALDWSQLPARVDGVIRSRIDRLEHQDRTMLSTASVGGEGFIAEVVASLLNTADRDVIQRLSSDLSRRHQLVESRDLERFGRQRISHYSFRHQLIQHFLYDELDAVERAYLHEDTAAVLETLYQGSLDEITVKLAWHYRIAGVTDKAAHFARLAGQLAASRNANDEAIGHFSTALALTPEKDMTTRLDLLLAREAVYGWQGKRAAQTKDLDELATVANDLHDPDAQARVELRRANLARLTGDLARAQDIVQKAVSLAEKARNALLEAQGFALLGRILLQTGKEFEAREWLELANEIAREQGDVRLQALSLYDLAHTYFANDELPEATERYQLAQALYEGVADRKGIANCLLMQGAVQRQCGNHDDALRYYDEALTTCRTVGWRHGESYVLSNLGNTYFVLGDFIQAGENHSAALAIRRDVLDRHGEAVNLDTLGLVAQYTGDVILADQRYRQALEIQRAIGDLRSEAYTLTHMGLLAEENGDLANAEAFQQSALAVRNRHATSGGSLVDNYAALARIALRAGNASDALARAKQTRDLLSSTGIEFSALAYLTIYQVLTATAGQDSAQMAEAAGVLSDGQTLIRRLAAALDDPALRERFLQNGPYNAELLAIDFAPE